MKKSTMFLIGSIVTGVAAALLTNKQIKEEVKEEVLLELQPTNEEES